MLRSVMILAVGILAVLGASSMLRPWLGAQTGEWAKPFQQVMGLVKSPNDAQSSATATRKLTVYQASGKHGETAFADERHAAASAHQRVVDNAKGSSFHSTRPKPADDDQEVDALDVSGQQHDIQHKAAELKRLQMDRAVGD